MNASVEHGVVLWESPDVRMEQMLAEAGARLVAMVPEDPLAAQAQALVTITRRVDAAVLDQFPRLKLVAVAFTGFDAVDLEACRSRGVRVANVPEYATQSTAELVVGLMLSALRRIPQSHHEMRLGNWNPLVGRELSGKTVGIIGTGRIGMRLAELLSVFSVRLVGWSRTPRQEFIRLGGVYHSSIAEVCAAADLISLHLALQPATKGLFGSREIGAMRPHAWLINASRGALVDEHALHEALTYGRIGGAALDVYSREPYTADPAFHGLENVIMLPHLGFRTEEALIERARVTVENLRGFFADCPSNLVA